jgi:ubiquinone/menaquinone biosynthesis C-methylase UbiE
MKFSTEKLSGSFYSFSKKAITPRLQYAQYIYEEVLRKKIDDNVKWIDLGCGHHLLPLWRKDNEEELIRKAKQVVGIDYDLLSLHKHRTIRNCVQSSIDELPFPNNYFDIATANMVVEHLDNPRLQFSEIHRVLRKDGIFIFHTPNEKGYFSVARKLISNKTARVLARFLDGRDETDVFEIQYKANNENAITQLAKDTGFEIDEIKFICTDAILAKVPPLVFFELLWIRLLMGKSLQKWRTNLIVVLRKI